MIKVCYLSKEHWRSGESSQVSLHLIGNSVWRRATFGKVRQMIISKISPEEEGVARQLPR